MELSQSSILGIRDLTAADIELILDTADSMKEILTRRIKKVPPLRGKLVVNLFFEPSTRTKSSFSLAVKRMSGDGMTITRDSSSLVKGESLVDTAKTLKALGADAVVIRHSAAGAPRLLAEAIDVPVLNAGDGRHEHPTQALLDLLTIRENRGKIENLDIAITGDIKHSRVARSNLWGMNKLGANVRLIGPPTLIPEEAGRLNADIYHDLEEGISGADVVYLLRIQQERQDKPLFPSLREYRELYGLRQKHLPLLADEAIIMHPGPINRDVEISPELAYSDRALIEKQVSLGVAIRMALLYLLIGGGEIEYEQDIAQ